MDSSHVVSSSYETEAGVKFTVAGIRNYPEAEVSDRYKGILAFNPGYLVAVSYRGSLIPNITLDEGVVRILAVVIDGKSLIHPHAISQALGVKESMTPYTIKKVK